jgi:hypothetical protein
MNGTPTCSIRKHDYELYIYVYYVYDDIFLILKNDLFSFKLIMAKCLSSGMVWIESMTWTPTRAKCYAEVCEQSIDKYKMCKMQINRKNSCY